MERGVHTYASSHPSAETTYLEANSPPVRHTVRSDTVSRHSACSPVMTWQYTTLVITGKLAQNMETGFHSVNIIDDGSPREVPLSRFGQARETATRAVDAARVSLAESGAWA
jgi:hypothetical protein